jgi:putative aldouronate transport system substrate-binding protein
MPTTTAEFKEVLIAFRDEDPNGNGKRDEIPFAGAIQGWHAGIDGFIMNSFIYTHGNLAEGPGADRLRVVDGRVDAVYDSEEWKAGLTYLNDLYTEDLIAPDSFVQDMNQYKQLGENPETVILGAATGGHMGVFAEFQGESGRWLDYTSVAPLEGPEGVRYARYNPVYGAPQWTITNRADHPSVAFRLGDAFYEDDVMLRNIYGLEGVHWRRAEPGELGINGKQGIWYKIVGRGQIDRTTWWNQAGPQLRSRDFRLGEVPAGPNNLAVILYDETKANYEPYTPDPRVIVPPLSFDSDIAAEYVELQTTINDYVTEMIARFITGDADVNARWEEYLDELDKIGLDRYLQITQDAYEKTQ